MTRATSPKTACRSADHQGERSLLEKWGGRSECVSSVPQDVLYPVETVVQAAGYVIHQVTAADRLKTGDQVQLHLDQVHPAAHT